ncbi:hypothetical protein [Pedobacter heparinus]|uniref:hypothetical protein n=1 Tax=Pedobacter heparinus TaxID=984 RepID=UPI00292CFEBF|nr:hypothetical protein [Pedobacter heparinus]
MNIRFLLLLCSLALMGCRDNSITSSDSQGGSSVDPDALEINAYEDGTYCAEVEYYYSKTGTNSTYTLSVEIEDNHIIRIDWPNGGWLDDTHFTPPDIEDGTAEFTSDRDVDYTVRILGEEGDCSLSSNAIDEGSMIDQHLKDGYQEELDAHEDENRLREVEEQEEMDSQEKEKESEEIVQSEDQINIT